MYAIWIFYEAETFTPTNGCDLCIWIQLRHVVVGNVRGSKQMAQVFLAMASFYYDVRATIFVGICQVEIEKQFTKAIDVEMKIGCLSLF
jgi:hypothetical protein